MSFENPNGLNDFEKLSEEERRTNLTRLLENPLEMQLVEDNKPLLCWGARHTYRSVSGDKAGSGNLDMNVQDLLAQDVPDISYPNRRIKEGIRMIRDPKKIRSFESFGRTTLVDLPDGIYTFVNIFEIEGGDMKRTNFLNEDQRKLWQVKDQFNEEEGMLFHPMFNDQQQLSAIKIYWQGHRTNLHLRTITIEEIKSFLHEGKQIDLSDYSIIRR